MLDPGGETSKEQVTICKNCAFAERMGSDDSSTSGQCLNKDAPYTEYVDGSKHCAVINKGHCEFFQILKGEERRHITEEEYKGLDSKLKSVIERLEYLVTCNQREPKNVTCYHAHSLDEPIHILILAKRILSVERE